MNTASGSLQPVLSNPADTGLNEVNGVVTRLGDEMRSLSDGQVVLTRRTRT